MGCRAQAKNKEPSYSFFSSLSIFRISDSLSPAMAFPVVPIHHLDRCVSICDKLQSLEEG